MGRIDMTRAGCCWEKGAKRLAQCRNATNLQFVKIPLSAKHTKATLTKRRCVCTRCRLCDDMLISARLWDPGRPYVDRNVPSKEVTFPM